jgi:peptidoglycan hydrolase CwlO-like protein
LPSLRVQRSCVAALVAVLAFSLCAPAMAAPSATSQLLSAQEQASAARARMDKMRSDLESGISRYEAASAKLSATRKKIAENTARLAKIDESVKEGQDHLATRAAFQYRTGAPGMIDVLFGASSFENFSSRLYVFSEIAKQDSELLMALKAQRAEAIALRSDLKKREAAQASELAQVATRQATVQKQVDAQDRYLESLSAEVSSLVAAQDKARAAAAIASAPKTAPAPSRAPKPSKTP